jgi:DNA-binding FadR family transcriptional regulator
MMTPKQTGALSSLVAQQLLDRILSGTLPPGTAMPSEREIQEEFGVSRTVVREAMKSLSARGLVQTQNGQNAIVSANLTGGAIDALMLAFHRERVHWEDLLDIRMLLEPHAAALAAESAAALQKRHIVDLAERMAAVRPTDQQRQQRAEQLWNETDGVFHSNVAAASQNPVLKILVELIVGIIWQQQSQAGFVMTPELITNVAHQHVAIAHAIAHGDSEGARDAMRAHLQATRESLAVGAIRAA